MKCIFACQIAIRVVAIFKGTFANNRLLVCAFNCAAKLWPPELAKESSAYLPGTGDTVIHQAVPPGRGLSIALRLG